MSLRFLPLVLLFSCGLPLPLPDAGLDAGLPAFNTQFLAASDALTFACGGTTLDDGTVFVVGTTNGGLEGASAKGQRDTFLARYAPDGTRAWVRQLGGPAPFPGFFVSSCSVRADAAGNTFLAGTTNGLGTLEGQQPANLYGAFVARFDALGQLVWLELLGDASGPTEVMSLELLPEGRLAVAGYTRTSTLGGTSSLGAGDVFLAFYSSLGALESVRRIGGAGEDVPSAFDLAGDSLVLATRVLNGAAGSVASQSIRVLDLTGAELRSSALSDPFVAVSLSATDAGIGLVSQELVSDGGVGGYRVELRGSSLEPLWSVTPEPRGRRSVFGFSCDAEACVVSGSTTITADGGTGTLFEGFVDSFAAGTATGTQRWADETGNAATRITWVQHVRGELAIAGFSGGTLQSRAPVGFADSFVMRR